MASVVFDTEILTSQKGMVKMNIGIWIIIIVGGITGVASTLYMVVSLPVVIVWKIYRKIKFKYSLFK